MEDGAFSHKIDYPNFLGDSKSLRASKLFHWFTNYGHVGKQGGFHLVVELHREGSAPVACAAGLILNLATLQVAMFANVFCDNYHSC